MGFSRSQQKRNQKPLRNLKSNRQTTLGSQTSVTGVGVHSGAPVSLTIGPAPINTGFLFVRTGLDGGDRRVRASAKSVIATEFATVVGDRTGPLVSTAEHVLAALLGMGVDNATIEVDGPEVPIMDGSAAAFVAAIDTAGIVPQKALRRFIEVLKPVHVAIGNSRAEFQPNSTGLRVEVEIDFPNPAVGRQTYHFDLTPQSFRRDIARARTFGFMNDVARLWSNGFALGSSFENSLVFDEDRLLNPEGLRYSDECARNKVLSTIGDLALAGLPLLGTYRSVRGGHKLNHAALTALLADRTAWRVVDAVRQPSSVAFARHNGNLEEKLSR
ncbi:UDP-3-O-acyl-N-acetylglucosamine deacetylase [Bradyrhizobium ontarionense]|uniref:UDP-3-O-acyl-N-acetylglucosamine deacetylase n=1 Tax=Bradyrhizobium ontarionense TaxID=2898149 RepID=UPI003CE4A8B3